MPLYGRDLPADGLDWIVKLSQVAHHEQQVSKRQHARADVADADEEHRRRSQRRGQSDEEAEVALGEREAHTAAHPFVRTADEALAFVLFLCKCLRHPEGTQYLVDNRHRRALELPHLSGLAAQARAICLRHEKNRR